MKRSAIIIAFSIAGLTAGIMPSQEAYGQGAPVVRPSAQGNESVADRLERLERMLIARNQGQADMLEQLGRLQRELSDLRGITEEHAHQLEQMLQRQRDIYQEIDRLSQQLRSGGGSSATSATTNALVVPETDVSFSTNLSENQAYDRAVALVLEERRYDAAIPQFKAFLEAYPGSAYTSNAHYWLGQLYYAQESYSEAITHFTAVVEQFPDSSKRADCILKLGLIAVNQNNRDRARQLFNQVRSEYPNSTEAGMAARQLESL